MCLTVKRRKFKKKKKREIDSPQVGNNSNKGFSGFQHFKPGQEEHLESRDTVFLPHLAKSRTMRISDRGPTVIDSSPYYLTWDMHLMRSLNRSRWLFSIYNIQWSCCQFHLQIRQWIKYTALQGSRTWSTLMFPQHVCSVQEEKGEIPYTLWLYKKSYLHTSWVHFLNTEKQEYICNSYRPLGILKQGRTCI